MSVSHTEAAVVARTKTVTRRLGWRFLKAGDRLTLCRKVMGRKPGEPLMRLAEVEVVNVSRQRLCDISESDVDFREGVPASVFTPDDAAGNAHELGCAECRRANWTGWFARTMGCKTDAEVTRIEWRYL